MSDKKARPKKKLSAKNIAAGFLMGLLALSLVGFGVEGFGTSGRNVASVGDREITANQYGRALQNELRAIQQQTGQAFTMEQARLFGIDQSVLQQLVTQAVLDNETGNLGISAGDTTIQREILQVASFQGAGGNFDREAYRFALQSAGLSENEFEQSVRDDLARSILQVATIGGIAAPEAQIAPIFDYQAQTRNLSILTMGEADLDAPVGAPDDNVLQAYYSENIARYSLEAGKRISYAMITPDMLFDTIEIETEQLQAAYDARRAEFVQPERRLVERLIFPDLDSAAAAIARLEAGEAEFETLVFERGLSLEDTDMGDVTRQQLGAAGDAVFGLTSPGVTGPHDSTLGPAIFRMNAVLAARETPLDEAAPALRDELVADRARRILADDLDLYEDLLAGGATVAQLAAETAMVAGNIDWRPDTSDGIARYNAFREAAAEANMGDFAEIRLLEDGGLFALEIDEILEAAPRPLAEIRAQVTRDWAQDEIVKRLREKAAGLQRALSLGQNFSDFDIVPERILAVSRRDFLPGLPRSLIASAFDLEVGEVAIVEEAPQLHLVRVEAVSPPDAALEDVARIRDQIARQIAQSYAQDLFHYFATSLQDQTPIQLNQSVIDAMQANF